MSNQEMQFADPDWKPSQKLDSNTNLQEQEGYHPEPINTKYHEQNQWRSPVSAPPEEEAYSGLRPYAGTTPPQMQSGNFRQRQYRRRGRSPLFWIILAFIIISLASGGFRSFSSPNFESAPFHEKPMMGNVLNYAVADQPIIEINDPNGTVEINVGQSGTVAIQAVSGNSMFGNPDNLQVHPIQNGNTIDVNVPDSQPGSVDLQVTVPSGADLNIKTVSGDINVTGVDGTMTLTTTNGDITASNDVMSGSSSLTADSGSINFEGDVNKGGTSQLKTNSGVVDFSVSNNSAFHLEASTNSGSIDIPGITPIRSGSGTKASGDLGASAQIQGTSVTINTNSGHITVNQTSQ